MNLLSKQSLLARYFQNNGKPIDNLLALQTKYYGNSEKYLQKLSKHNETTYQDWIQFIGNHVLPQDKTLLEVGCGTGLSAYLIAKHFPQLEITATDISPNFIKTAKNMYQLKKLTYQVSNAVDTQFDNGSFDIITLFDVIEHIFDVKKFIKEVDRLLTPGGLILISSPNVLNLEIPYKDFVKKRHRLPYTTNSFENLPLFFFNLIKVFSKKISSEVSFDYIQPLLEEDNSQYSDTDIAYLANPVDLYKSLESMGYKVLSRSTFQERHPRLSFLAPLLEDFYSIRIAAKKPREIGRE